MNKKTLVLGASKKSKRYSNMAIRKLIGFDYEVVAHGLKQGEILEVNIDTELLSYKNIDTVTMYLNAIEQKDYYNYIVLLKPKRVIFNPGTENPGFYQILKENDIDFEEACTLTLLATNQY